MGGQVCGDRTAGNPKQRAARKQLNRAWTRRVGFGKTAGDVEHDLTLADRIPTPTLQLVT
jgi:hypothetical protein